MSAAGGLPLSKLHAVQGVSLGATAAGIRKSGRKDLVVLALAESTRAAAVFTRNAFCAAPVIVARDHLQQAQPRFLLVNTGYANAGTGSAGLMDARGCCAALAALTGCEPTEVLPFSTGVIGEPLPVTRIVAGLPDALANLRVDGWAEAALGIMTTDTVPKGASRQLDIDGRTITVTGMAKGAGMIRPDMATMLAFVATDAVLDSVPLRRCLEAAVAGSFNRITVDGDTSTNDACVLLATGASAMEPIRDETSGAYRALVAAVGEVCVELAQALIRDGEGATKFITVEVVEGLDESECLAVAYAVAESPLVKTACFAGDPNWGRILAAVGRSGVAKLDVERVSIWLDELRIVHDGGRAAEYREELGQAVMARDRVTVRIHLGRGEISACVWTCDLSYDYVRINAEYRT